LSSIELKRQGIPQPAGSVLISPFIDTALRSFDGGNALTETDYLVDVNERVPRTNAMFLAGIPGDHGNVNPFYCDTTEMEGLNPQLILAGGGEFAVEESRILADRCQKSGVKYDLVVEWGQLHLYALGSKWIDPTIRKETDSKIFRWFQECLKLAH
jgi:acetyl esterase/lipase